MIRYGGLGAAALVVLVAGASLFSGGEEAAEPETVGLASDAKAKEKPEADKAPPSAGEKASAAAQPEAGKTGGSLPTQAEADAKKAAADAKEKSAEAEKAPSAGDLFTSENTIDGKSCEDVLGHPKQYFAKTAKWRSAHAWKLARKNLVAGHEEEAHKQMCRSAFIDPRGSGVSGLVKYYLSQRALKRALGWAEAGVEAKAGSRHEAEAKQLLGDVLIQMGEVEKAKKIWLESFGLEATDSAKLEKVCSTFYTSALKTRKGGDSNIAEQYLRRAAAFQPDNPAIAAELAKTLLLNEQKTLAKRWADKALALEEDSSVAKEVLAQL